MSTLELSPREVDIARFTALGLTAAAIAPMLGISHKTVETYRDRIRLKWGLTTVREIPAAYFTRRER